MAPLHVTQICIAHLSIYTWSPICFACAHGNSNSTRAAHLVTLAAPRAPPSLPRSPLAGSAPAAPAGVTALRRCAAFFAVSVRGGFQSTKHLGPCGEPSSDTTCTRSTPAPTSLRSRSQLLIQQVALELERNAKELQVPMPQVRGLKRQLSRACGVETLHSSQSGRILGSKATTLESSDLNAHRAAPGRAAVGWPRWRLSPRRWAGCCSSAHTPGAAAGAPALCGNRTRPCKFGFVVLGFPSTP